MVRIVIGSRRRTIGRAVVRAAVASLLGVAVVGGCSAPSTPPSTPPPPAAAPAAAAPGTYSPELCSAAAQFQTAGNAVSQLDATKIGTGGVKDALQNLADAGRALVTTAEAQFGPQVAELKQSVASLQNTIAGIGDQDNLSAKLGALTASVAQVEAAAKPIVDSVRTGCPGIPPVQTPPTS